MILRIKNYYGRIIKNIILIFVDILLKKKRHFRIEINYGQNSVLYGNDIF